MFEESMKEAITKLKHLQSLQEKIDDEDFDEVIDLLQIALKIASKSRKPLNDDEAKEIYKKLRPGWRPLDFVRLVEKQHSIT